MFIGDIKNDNLDHFKLDEQRKGLQLGGSLTDKIGTKMRSTSYLRARIWRYYKHRIGPDGYLYILTYSEEDGTIYRIVPAENNEEK